MLSFGSRDIHDPNLCACGCGAHVAYDGLEPRFAFGACRTRWVDKWAIGPCEPEPAVLDDRPQAPPPPADPVPAQEVADVRAEFAQRVTVAPQVETALSPPSGAWVRPRPGALLKFLLRATRKVR